MSKTKKVTITLTQDQQEYARKESIEALGIEKGNISGFYVFLLGVWKKNKSKLNKL